MDLVSLCHSQRRGKRGVKQTFLPTDPVRIRACSADIPLDEDRILCIDPGPGEAVLPLPEYGGPVAYFPHWVCVLGVVAFDVEAGLALYEGGQAEGVHFVVAALIKVDVCRCELHEERQKGGECCHQCPDFGGHCEYRCKAE